jgi:hypothetical protein
LSFCSLYNPAYKSQGHVFPYTLHIIMLWIT